MLTLAYSSGLRVSEIANLKLEDIIREKMLLRVREGKGNKDRYTILSIIALKTLEKYWKVYRPQTWLFPGRQNNKISNRACEHAFEIAKKKANITRTGSFHTLRHSFATHYLEVGGSLFQLQKFMGHIDIRTTLKYVHLRDEARIAKSPLDVYAESYCK
jgi:integrase/recombinase XerD